MGLPFISVARAGFALYSVQQATGVIGFDQIAGSLVRLVPKIALKMRRRHEGMAQEIVDLAKSRVPVDTGELQNGISWDFVDDDTIEVTALAVHGDENYARDIEWGHNAGGITVASDDWFEGRASRRSKGRTHVDAEPFFFNSADEVFRRHGHELAEIAPGVAREDGWETA